MIILGPLFLSLKNLFLMVVLILLKALLEIINVGSIVVMNMIFVFGLVVVANNETLQIAGLGSVFLKQEVLPMLS